MEKINEKESGKELMKKARSLVGTLLQEGVDFGSVPGIPRPFLWKPGAEKVMRELGYGFETDIVECSTPKGGVVAKCSLYSPDGRRVGARLGCADTSEKSLRGRDWRMVVSMAEKRAIVACCLSFFPIDFYDTDNLHPEIGQVASVSAPQKLKNMIGKIITKMDLSEAAKSSLRTMPQETIYECIELLDAACGFKNLELSAGKGAGGMSANKYVDDLDSIDGNSLVSPTEAKILSEAVGKIEDDEERQLVIDRISKTVGYEVKRSTDIKKKDFNAVLKLLAGLNETTEEEVATVQDAESEETEIEQDTEPDESVPSVDDLRKSVKKSGLSIEEIRQNLSEVFGIEIVSVEDIPPDRRKEAMAMIIAA